MKINLHNYEHYFLMYIDNELSAQEKTAVNDFIKQYPEYAKELQDLQETKIHPATINYEDKFLLYQLSEQDAACLTYLDNEMPLVEKKSFEQNLSSNTLLQANLDTWQKTILPKDALLEIDPDFKDSLYKNSAQIKPLWTNFSFKQWASVAAILAVVIGFSLFNAQKKQALSSFTNNIDGKGELHKAAVTEINNGADINATKNTIVLNTIKKGTPLSIVASKEQGQNKQIKNNSNAFIIKNVAVPNQDIAIVILPKTASYTNSMNEKVTFSKEVLPITISDIKEKTNTDLEVIAPPQVQYSNMDTDEEERSINIANIEIDGAKFRELSRKITTLFKRNKPENDKYK